MVMAASFEAIERFENSLDSFGIGIRPVRDAEGAVRAMCGNELN
jgi:hypothetical protein